MPPLFPPKQLTLFCENEIEILRQIYAIDREIIIFIVSGLENEIAYKDYFGLS